MARTAPTTAGRTFGSFREIADFPRASKRELVGPAAFVEQMRPRLLLCDKVSDERAVAAHDERVGEAGA